MPAPASSDPHAFVTTQTAIETAPLVPEISLRLASEVVPLWQATESELEALGLPPPYWAFAWTGGQALARYLLDSPETVAGKRVLDFAAGSGIQAIAAARSGAAEVTASEIDPFALAAIALNARLNDVRVASRSDNLIGLDEGWDVVLAGDVCYERPMAEAVFAWLRRLVARGALVLLGDPGRTYLPRSGLSRVTAYSVKTSRELEDCDVRNAVVWKVGK
ncbi:MAG: class I SAM-dependent methyltransferase [Kiloniellales bacterium]